MGKQPLSAELLHRCFVYLPIESSNEKPTPTQNTQRTFRALTVDAQIIQYIAHSNIVKTRDYECMHTST